MSDEYASTGFKGSLVNDSAGTTMPENKGENAHRTDYETRNYPPSGDTTSSGGYRSVEDPECQPEGGLLEQSTNGGDLRGQLHDAKQGRDEHAREQMNLYYKSTLESRQEGEEALASRYNSARDNAYEGSGAAGNDEDVGS